MINKKDINILFLINSVSNGGAEGVFMNEVKALVSLGYQTEISTLYPDKFKNLYDFNGYLALIRKIKKENITHVYSTLDDANFVAKIVRIFVKFKLFCREANMTEDKSIKFKAADILLNFLVYKLVMVAEAVKYSYLSYDPYHKHKMYVLLNGVAIPEVTQRREVSSPVKILAVGGITQKKGFADLVQIIRDYVLKNNKNFVLEIIGGGPLLSQIKSQIQDFGLEDYIKCLGAMNKEGLKAKYEEADIFVLTSKKEGCPNVLLEAASYGLAPVCFGVGAVPEILENNISGIVIAKGDREAFGKAISDLLSNPTKIITLGLGARERMIKNFSFDVHMKNLLYTLELK